MSVRVTAPLLSLLALSSLSCGEAFPPYWRVEGLRVLGIQAEPVTLRQGEEATLSALIHTPDDTPLSYTWEWCPFTTSAQDQYKCPFTRDELGVPNWRGTVGLSTRGRDTGDAQFYINLVDNVRLDHEYTVFAVVTRGMDVVDRLLEGAVIRRVTERQR